MGQENTSTSVIDTQSSLDTTNYLQLGGELSLSEMSQHKSLNKEALSIDLAVQKK